MTGGRTVFTYYGERSETPKGGAPFILDRSYTITADVEIPQDGAEGNPAIVVDTRNPSVSKYCV